VFFVPRTGGAVRGQDPPPEWRRSRGPNVIIKTSTGYSSAPGVSALLDVIAVIRETK